MATARDIREHMEVLGSDGTHVGTVDHMEGQTRLKLTKDDPASKGHHHFIPMDWVDHVDAQVHLKKTGQDAMKQWQSTPLPG